MRAHNGNSTSKRPRRQLHVLRRQFRRCSGAAAYLFAVRSITQGGLFRAEYDALCARNGGQKLKAIVAVMRSGLRLMYSIARDRRSYTAEPPRQRARPTLEGIPA
jgi:hypothetical protein